MKETTPETGLSGFYSVHREGEWISVKVLGNPDETTDVGVHGGSKSNLITVSASRRLMRPI